MRISPLVTLRIPYLQILTAFEYVLQTRDLPKLGGRVMCFPVALVRELIRSVWRTNRPMALVLRPDVPLWREGHAARLKDLREVLLARIIGRWGEEEARAVAPKVRSATPERLHLALRRMSYAPELHHLFDLRWRLSSSVCDVRTLIFHALGTPLDRWGILLLLNTGYNDQRHLGGASAEVPWLGDLEAPLSLEREVASQGWAFLTCETEPEAHALQSSIRSNRFSCQLFRPDGRIAKR